MLNYSRETGVFVARRSGNYLAFYRFVWDWCRFMALFIDVPVCFHASRTTSPDAGASIR